MAQLARIAFIDDTEFFPIQQTLVGKHLYKAVEAPIIIHQTVANASLTLFFGSLLLLMLLPDHLPLGKIADNHSSFSQSTRDQMGGFVQTVLLFTAFAFGTSRVFKSISLSI